MKRASFIRTVGRRRPALAVLPLCALLCCCTSAGASDVAVQRGDSQIKITWPTEGGEAGRITFDLSPRRPLITEMCVGDAVVLRDVDPVLVMTVGTRNLNDKAGWIAFFDNPPRRPHETHGATLAKSGARVETAGRRTTVVVEGLTCGPFSGAMHFTFFPGARIVQAEAVVSTKRDACAITYDAGLVSAKPSWSNVAWIDNKRDALQRAPADAEATPRAVRHRAIVAESGGGSSGGAVAIFPPPHQYLYPLDFADNFGFTWHGRKWRGVVAEAGFGVRQSIEGDKRYVPWVNAPPGTSQRLGVFYLLSAGDASHALDEVRRFTRGDRFKKLDGYKVFTSHYHVEHTLDFLAKQKEQQTKGVPRGLEEPGFVKAFKTLGVDIVHLAEFHVHHTPEMNAKRLELLRTMHGECARLSDENLLLLPGEEPNVHLGGHWVSFFPKPVYWTLQRGENQPFVEQNDRFGAIYHVGSAADVLRLMERERGLMWTAHPRIKGSFGFPDAQRQTDFFRSDRFLGAAWKAMPADYSHDRLGARVLDLLDDMNTWGPPKHVLGEVDVFRVEPDYELYGHMNVNYVKLGHAPRFSDGWHPLLDALRRGDFFVTTGEVLISSFEAHATSNELRATVEWTFPLASAEVISSDGAKVYRDRIDLRDTDAFGSRQLKIPVELAGRKWARLEVWDVATNGAFTQPVWLDGAR